MPWFPTSSLNSSVRMHLPTEPRSAAQPVASGESPLSIVLPPSISVKNEAPCDLRPYVEAGVSNTARAWSAPTALAMTLPPPFRWTGLVLAGQIHADNRQKAPAIVKEMPLKFRERQVDRSAAYAPFVGTLMTHTRLMEMAKDGKGPLPLLTQAIEAPMKKVVPASAARNAANYLAYVPLRASAQLGASAIGGVASYRWVRDGCAARPREATPQELEKGASRSPEAYLAAGAVFAPAALLATPRGAALLTRRLGPKVAAYVPAVLVPVSCVVADEAVVQATALSQARRSPAH